MDQREFEEALYFVMEAVGVMDDKMKEAVEWREAAKKGKPELYGATRKNYFEVVQMVTNLYYELDKRKWNSTFDYEENMARIEAEKSKKSSE